MRKFECNMCGCFSCGAETIFDVPPDQCLYGRSASAWQPVESKPQLPRLTAAIFDHPDCPVEAKIAVINGNGWIHFGTYESATPADTVEWYGVAPGKWLHVDQEKFGRFDPSDWKSSLVKRPAKLPEWCRVGEWVYREESPDDDMPFDFAFGQITSIDGRWIVVDGHGIVHVKHLSPARLRPWTNATLPPIPFAVKIKNNQDHFRTTVTAASTAGVWLGGATKAIGYAELMDECEQLDGQPCGVLELAERK